MGMTMINSATMVATCNLLALNQMMPTVALSANFQAMHKQIGRQNQDVSSCREIDHLKASPSPSSPSPSSPSIATIIILTTTNITITTTTIIIIIGTSIDTSIITRPYMRADEELYQTK
jgi:hypothetical protein